MSHSRCNSCRLSQRTALNLLERVIVEGGNSPFCRIFILDTSLIDFSKGYSLKPKIVLTGYLHPANRFLHDETDLRGKLNRPQAREKTASGDMNKGKTLCSTWMGIGQMNKAKEEPRRRRTTHSQREREEERSNEQSETEKCEQRRRSRPQGRHTAVAMATCYPQPSLAEARTLVEGRSVRKAKGWCGVVTLFQRNVTNTAGSDGVVRVLEQTAEAKKKKKISVADSVLRIHQTS